VQVGWVKHNTLFPLLKEFLFDLILGLAYVIVGVYFVVIGAFIEVRLGGVYEIVEIEGHVAELDAERLQRVLF
jgi:hypothetical protein